MKCCNPAAFALQCSIENLLENAAQQWCSKMRFYLGEATKITYKFQSYITALVLVVRELRHRQDRNAFFP